MKKNALLPIFISLVCGIAGAVLHYIQLSTVIDPKTGLAERCAPVSIVLAVFSVLVAVALFLLAFRAKGDVQPVYHRALAAKSFLPLIISIALALMMIYASVACFWGDFLKNSNGIFSIVLSVFILLAGVSYAAMSFSAFRGKSGGGTTLASFIIVLFVCYWLIISYKENASDPTIINFVYDFLGLCAASVATYYIAGYAFGRSRPRASLFFSSVGVYFCLTSMLTAQSLAFKILYLFVSVYMFVSCVILACNLRPVEESKTEQQQDGE